MTVADTIVVAAFSYLGQNGRRKDREDRGSEAEGENKEGRIGGEASEAR